MPIDRDILDRLYDRFNGRDMDAVLAMMHEDVIWANGMEGGYVYGREAVRRYWTRQWAMIDPRVELANVSERPDGSFMVEVHQTLRDLQGNVLSDKMVGHVFQIEERLIRRFDIQAS